VPAPIPISPADAYLQRHAALLTTNRTLRISLIAFAALLAVLTYGYFSLSRTYANVKPLIIRIDEVGRAQAIDYSPAEYKVQEAEMKFFLKNFIEKHYGRLRGSAKADFADSLYFLTPHLVDLALDQEKQSHSLDAFLHGASDQIEISVKHISLDDIRQQPYKATVTYEKTYYSQYEHTANGAALFTASIQFIVLDRVPNQLIPINPLGLTINYLHEDQALVNAPTSPDASRPPTNQ
jgi:type IV secretion system protein VirB5